jgi:hypothetical protein
MDDEIFVAKEEAGQLVRRTVMFKPDLFIELRGSFKILHTEISPNFFRFHTRWY